MGQGRPRHVWVDLTGRWADPSPGLLLEWRQGRRGWEGWVIRIDTYSTGAGAASQVVQSWVPAGLLRPAVAPQPEMDLSGFHPVGERR